ncbi:hypothetical protein ACHAQD_012427 [Fusarium lateritium]
MDTPSLNRLVENAQSVQNDLQGQVERHTIFPVDYNQPAEKHAPEMVPRYHQKSIIRCKEVLNNAKHEEQATAEAETAAQAKLTEAGTSLPAEIANLESRVATQNVVAKASRKAKEDIAI